MTTEQWFLSNEDNHVRAQTADGETTICEVWGTKEQARMIATAPDMLRALREIAEGKGRFSLDQYQHACNTIEDMITKAMEAIDKATGAT